MQDPLEDYLRAARKSKQNDPVKISKEMLVSAHLKKECDSRAMKIVEFSIEGKLRPEVFTRCLPFINQAHYQDIVEERAITKLCGYSLCGKRLPDMPKKQYFISTKSNKVYDITARKNFCSNFCYKASIHIKKQIDNSPLWLRKLEDIPEYKLLHSTEGGQPGDLIDQGVVKPVRDEMAFTSVNSFAEASLGDIKEKGTGSGRNNGKSSGFKKSSRLKSTMQTIKETEIEEEITVDNIAKSGKRQDQKRSVKSCKKTCIVNLPSIEENDEKAQSGKENDNVIKEQQERLNDIGTRSSSNGPVLVETIRNTKSEPINESREPNSTRSHPGIPLEKSSRNNTKKRPASGCKALDIGSIIKNAVEDWITLETCIFVHGETKVKNVLNEKKMGNYFDELHIQGLQREQQMKYMEICRRLQFREMADDKFDHAIVGGQKLKPLPDFRKLKEDTKDMKIKVKSFYDGTMYEQNDKNFPSVINKPVHEGESEEGPPAVLPLVDANSQNLMRRKIFLTSASKATQQLLQTIGAPSYSSVLAELQVLAKTFTLKANNITFKPIVWNYIALVLLGLLSIKNEELKELLADRRAQEYIQMLFEVLPEKRDFISDVLENVRNIEVFVERYITTNSNHM